MPAFSHSTFHCITSAHTRLRDRMVSMFEFTIDPHQLFELLVSPEDRAVLKRAKELGLRSPSYHSVVTLRVGPHTVNVDCEKCGPLPHDLTGKKYDLNPSWPFAQAVTDWAYELGSLYEEFDEGDQILALLHDKCSSPKQVRYLLPAIVTLLSIGECEELASKLSTTPTVRGLPALPPGVRQAIMNYNSLIAKASLLPVPQATSRGTRFTFSRTKMPEWSIYGQ